MNEVWKEIQKCSCYYVSNLGNIKRVYKNKKEKILKPFKISGGYLQVKLNYNGQTKNCLVHDLVFETFYRRLLPNEIVHHLSEIKTENFATNLVAKDRRFHTYSHNKGKQYFLGHTHTEETKKKMSISARNRNNTNNGEDNK